MDYTAKSIRSNLTGSQVLDIRRLLTEGFNDRQLAKKYSVSRKAIYDIDRRRTWKEVRHPTTVAGFRGYQVYPDGRVFSVTKGVFLAQAKRALGPVVKLTNSRGYRKVVPVSALLNSAFG